MPGMPQLGQLHTIPRREMRLPKAVGREPIALKERGLLTCQAWYWFTRLIETGNISSSMMPSLRIRDMDKPEADKQAQRKRFIETARELGCDEDEAAFDEKLRKIATAKPKPRNKKVPKSS